MSSTLTATCHGSRASAMPVNTTASTIALRTITAFRLYLSAQTPHSGTSGIPSTNSSALNSPMNERRSASGTPSVVSCEGSSAKTWLTPRPSTMDVIQKTVTSAGHPCRPVVGIRRSLLETDPGPEARYARRWR